MRFPRKAGIVIVLAAFLISTSLTFATASNPPSPTLQVTVSEHHYAITSQFDTILSVNLPSQQAAGPANLFVTSQFFILQTISISDVRPDGVIDPPNTLVTCTATSLNPRNAHLDCSGSLFFWRVNPQAYPGTSTGVYYVGFAGQGPETGVWTYTYTVTGLYNGQSIVLTKSFNVNVDPPASSGPVQYS